MAKGTMNSSSDKNSGASSAAWGTRSSEEALGINRRITLGTLGSRDTISHAKYGGNKKAGELFKGNSEGSPSKEMNSGNAEKRSSNATTVGKFGPPVGTVGSREMMTLGGDKNVGKLVGKGAGATGPTKPESLQKGGRVASTSDLLTGTADARGQMKRAKLDAAGGKNKR